MPIRQPAGRACSLIMSQTNHQDRALGKSCVLVTWSHTEKLPWWWVLTLQQQTELSRCHGKDFYWQFKVYVNRNWPQIRSNLVLISLLLPKSFYSSISTSPSANLWREDHCWAALLTSMFHTLSPQTKIKLKLSNVFAIWIFRLAVPLTWRGHL